MKYFKYYIPLNMSFRNTYFTVSTFHSSLNPFAFSDFKKIHECNNFCIAGTLMDKI